MSNKSRSCLDASDFLPHDQTMSRIVLAHISRKYVNQLVSIFAVESNCVKENCGHG